jgi:hypothetical protein
MLKFLLAPGTSSATQSRENHFDNVRLDCAAAVS